MDTAAQNAWNQAQQKASQDAQKRRTILIDPITRLEGHGKIEIFLNDTGQVDRAYFQVPELRGFEVFSKGRPAEDMPQITSRICGVCPTAHHMASTKALDDLYKVEPTLTAKKIRELVYSVFMLEDHALHVYFLGGPDFIVGPDAPKEIRNVIGVIQKVGKEVAGKVIEMRRRLRGLITTVGGKVIHPVMGLPGGVAKGIPKEDLEAFKQLSHDAVDFALFTLSTFDKLVLQNKAYVDLILNDAYTHRTYYMGMVDANKKVNFYDGKLRVVDPDGKEYALFSSQQYLDYVAEHVEPWSYIKFCYLKPLGWQGFKDGKESSVYAVAPLARLNASEGMATPKAQAAYEQFFKTLGGKPVHHTLANHYARVVEMVYAAERFEELINDPGITATDLRTIPTATPVKGIGVVEAPRGTLFHHFETGPDGLITMANLIVATQNNAARIALSVDKAARGMIKDGKVSDGILNLVEMAFRAYDPCHGCGTHALPGRIPLIVNVRDLQGNVIQTLKR
jgi:F420-non-reducing hydrogenase large subunit